MEYHVIPHCLPGYPDSKSIRIVYDIPAGIQVRSKLECKSALMAQCLDPPPLPLYDSFIVDIAENIHRGREALICSEKDVAPLEMGGGALKKKT